MPGSLALLSGSAGSSAGGSAGSSTGSSAGGSADVVFVAHTGLDRLDSLVRIWHGVPLREPLTASWWRVPGSEVPSAKAAQEEWLTNQWSKVDSWIDHEWQQTDRQQG
jgi:hypothetical protein